MIKWGHKIVSGKKLRFASGPLEGAIPRVLKLPADDNEGRPFSYRNYLDAQKRI